MAQKNTPIMITPEWKERAFQQVLEQSKEISYDTRDYPIGYLRDLFNNRQDLIIRPEPDKKGFFIPPYQRKLVWNNAKQSRFIESLLLGLPIPFLFVVETYDGFLEIIDGSQRIRSVARFLNNDLTLCDLNALTELNGFRSSDLPIALLRKLENRSLRVILLSSSISEDVKRDIFDRINTGSVILRPAEVRRGIYEGPLTQFLNDMAEVDLFETTCPVSETKALRGERLELVTRFFAYSENYQACRQDVKGFLRDFVHDQLNDFDEERYREEFFATLSFVAQHFEHGFAKSPQGKSQKPPSSTPRVRFEAISVGVNLALRIKPGLVPSSMQWLDSEEFKKLTTSDASNNPGRLARRIEFVRDQLLGRV